MSEPAEPTLLECVEVEPEGPADAAVIWLHGLGADGRDFLPLLPYLGLPEGHAIRFVFPNAPMRPVTANGGWTMPAWYDIADLAFPRRIDPAEIAAAETDLRALVAREQARGVAAGRIVLAGFSQGGAVALHTGLRHPEPLAGVLALSCYLPVPEALAPRCRQDTPVLLLHGEHDAVIPLAEAEATRQQLREHGVEPLWHTWPMGHEVRPEEARLIGAWLAERLPPA